MGFSVIEVLAAISLSAIFFSAAALVYQNMAANQNRLASLETVALGSTNLQNFYGLDEEAISVYSSPNYGRVGFANELREKFREDIGQSGAVYCLGRSDLNTIRPSTIPYPAGSDVLDTPEKFRQHLVTQYGTAAAPFVAYSGKSSAEDASIYLTQPAAAGTELDVVAVYDIDVVPLPDATTPTMNYVSVRRYIDGSLAGYYDVVYPIGTGNPFNPLVVHFERFARQSSVGNDPVLNKWMKANEASFYFIWWPDPASPFLEAPDPPTPFEIGDPSHNPAWDFYKMGGRTSFMFTVPMFPALY
ncbi:MAG: hypothetical protein ACI8UO_001065 [Verrucomicrobiales bacterium]